MSAVVLPVQIHRNHCHETPAFNHCPPQPKGDLQHTPHKKFINVTHGTLWISQLPDSPQSTSENIPVTVLDGSTSTKVPLVVKSTDTIGKLKQAYIMKKPHIKGTLNLILNGKNAHSEDTLCELGVKPGTTFITYQKCVGG